MNFNRPGLALALFVFAASLQAFAQTPKVVIEDDERSFANGRVDFQRGVFRVEPDGAQISLLCNRVEGRWRQVGSGKDCGDAPPPQLQAEKERFPDDVTAIMVRNLGIDNEQWDKLRQPSASSGMSLRKIGEALTFQTTSHDVRWHFDSASLPDKLKTPIPGAAVAIHFGHHLSEERQPLVFVDGTTLMVEASIALPRASTTGKAHTGVTLAVNLDVPTVSGKRVGLLQVVRLFPEKTKEDVRSDGRTNYGSSPLDPKSRFISKVANQTKSSTWASPERFAFKFTQESMRNLIAEANSRESPSGKARDLYDAKRIDQIRFSGVTLRNENRFLDQGNVTVDVVVDYLRVVRTPVR